MSEALQIDQNQCRHWKGYYGFDQPKSAAGAGGLSRASRPSVYHTLPGNERRGVMTAPVPEYSMPIYEMMARLGIEPGAGVLPPLSLRYATAVRRCESCQSKTACQNWLDYAPAMVNFAPDFCTNADILFDLQYEQAGPRRANRVPTL